VDGRTKGKRLQGLPIGGGMALMVQVNIAGLVAAIQKAPPFSFPEMNEGATYLFNLVYNHMANDNAVRLSELDFSAFEAEDINSLADLYNDVIEKNNHHADSIASTLRKIDPVCRVAAYV
jgi:hypothetical protein